MLDVKDGWRGAFDMRRVGTICCGLLLVLGSCARGAPGDEPDAPASRDEYAALAEKAGRDATAQVRLALWCEERSLGPERLKHLARAVLIEPGNVRARGLLGLLE